MEETESGMKINSRIIELLKRVQETDSLDNAVKEMGFSTLMAGTHYTKQRIHILLGGDSCNFLVCWKLIICIISLSFLKGIF